MPGVASVILTQEELSALVLASTNKGTKLSPRYEASIIPKLNEARSQLGCPVPQRPDAVLNVDGQTIIVDHKVYDAAGCRIDGSPGDYA